MCVSYQVYIDLDPDWDTKDPPNEDIPFLLLLAPPLRIFDLPDDFDADDDEDDFIDFILGAIPVHTPECPSKYAYKYIQTCIWNNYVSSK